MSFIKLTYSSVIKSEQYMYDDVKAFLVDKSIDARLINNIMLSVSEAFTNALLHGNQSDPNKSIHISITTNNDEIIADITDEGSGDVEHLGSHEEADLWQEGGRGMMLIKRISREVAFSKSIKTGGTQVTIKFDRNKYKHKVEQNI